MKAYIAVRTLTASYQADVVTEQDYYECGPWSRSFRSRHWPTATEARKEAREWAEKWQYEIVGSADDFAHGDQWKASSRNMTKNGNQQRSEPFSE